MKKLTKDQLRAAEQELTRKYKKVGIVKGSLKAPRANGKYANKRTVLLTCAKRGCQKKCQRATSDLFSICQQGWLCPDHAE